MQQSLFDSDDGRPPVQPLLDTQETSVDPRPLDAAEDRYWTANGPYDCWRHSGWQRDRQRVFRALRAAASGRNRLNQFATCGMDWIVYRSSTDPQHFRAAPATCHDRFCLPCAQDRAARIRNAVMRLVTPRPHRFMTLTLRSSDLPLTRQIDRLLKSFRRLRARSWWRRRVDGGASFLELTYNADIKRWHPHLHIICHGRYLDLGQLRDNWLAVTGDSYIVDIRLIRDLAITAQYVAKYGSKPISTTVLRNAPALHEAIEALKGRRLVGCFGDWHGLPLLRAAEETEWEFYDFASSLMLTPSLGDVRDASFRAWLQALAKGRALPDYIDSPGTSSPPERSPPVDL